MLTIIAPQLARDQSFKNETHLILNEMILNGSTPATFRNSELEALERLQERLECLGTFNQVHVPVSVRPTPHQSSALLDYSGLSYDNPNIDSLNGLAADQILSVAQLLPMDTLNNEPWQDDWIWQQQTEGPGRMAS